MRSTTLKRSKARTRRQTRTALSALTYFAATRIHPRRGTGNAAGANCLGVAAQQGEHLIVPAARQLPLHHDKVSGTTYDQTTRQDCSHG